MPLGVVDALKWSMSMIATVSGRSWRRAPLTMPASWVRMKRRLESPVSGSSNSSASSRLAWATISSCRPLVRPAACTRVTSSASCTGSTRKSCTPRCSAASARSMPGSPGSTSSTAVRNAVGSLLIFSTSPFPAASSTTATSGSHCRQRSRASLTQSHSATSWPASASTLRKRRRSLARPWATTTRISGRSRTPEPSSFNLVRASRAPLRDIRADRPRNIAAFPPPWRKTRHLVTARAHRAVTLTRPTQPQFVPERQAATRRVSTTSCPICSISASTLSKRRSPRRRSRKSRRSSWP